MIEKKMDLWTEIDDPVYQKIWRCVLTNGNLKRNGEAVMGKGCALEAVEKYPDLPVLLGSSIRKFGNQVFSFNEYSIITFPTKYDWYDDSDISLILKSAKELSKKINEEHLYLLPRPGCGFGGLQWNNVKKVIAEFLPDNVIVVYK